MLLDLLLPVMNGYDVLKEIRGNPSSKNLPIIMLTAVASKDVEQEVIKLGANHYMTKPWKLGDMLDVILEALGTRLKRFRNYKKRPQLAGPEPQRHRYFEGKDHGS